MEEKMPAGKFKAECLKIMDCVNATGREMTITKRNIPIARIVPYRKKKLNFIGMFEGQIEILGDIMSPIDEVWDAES